MHNAYRYDSFALICHNALLFHFKEADWVDSNRAELIQSVTLVMPIADQMLQRGIIHKEKYNQIRTMSTSQDQMREVYSALTSTKAKSVFYRICSEIYPQIFESTCNPILRVDI